MIDIRTGDALDELRKMPDESVQCCVTSPPYWGLRDYGVAGQIGLEPTLAEFIAKLVAVFREVRRVLQKDGVCWVNMGDAFAGSWGAQSRGGPPSESSTLAGNGHVGGGPKIKSLSAVQIENHPKTTRTGSFDRTGIPAKNLMGQPWRLAFAMQDDGWILRSECIWHKPNPMPESITDRPTKSHEQVFLFAKSPRYFYDADAVREPATNRDPGNINASKFAGSDPVRGRTRAGLHTYGPVTERNIRTVWTISSEPLKDAHFAAFPQALARICVLSGSRPVDVVLDPFCGAGTTGLVAIGLGRRFVGIELNPQYVKLAKRRIQAEVGILAAAMRPQTKETTP